MKGNDMKVEFTDNEIKVMQTALDQWGLAAQVGQTVEECAELIVALQKYINRTPKPDALKNIIDEIADVEMMLAQMRLVFGIGDDTLRKRIEYKFEKLNQYLSED
jgi:NTP pyrophosphatase (non-canonical NTP hydrolase)